MKEIIVDGKSDDSLSSNLFVLHSIFKGVDKERLTFNGQYYQKKDFLDICIVDRGRGIAQAYKDELKLTLSDEEAITQAMQGKSTKRSKERGFGIRTSKKVICNALGGSFIFISGNVALLANKGHDLFVNLPDFYWQGVIMGFRIPKPAADVNIYKFIE